MKFILQGKVECKKNRGRHKIPWEKEVENWMGGVFGDWEYLLPWPDHFRSLKILKKIATQATALMAADKEAVGLSRVHMNEPKCILPCLYEIIVYTVLKHINTARIHTIR